MEMGDKFKLYLYEYKNNLINLLPIHINNIK